MSTTLSTKDGVIIIKGHNGLAVEVYPGGSISIATDKQTIDVTVRDGRVIIDGHDFESMTKLTYDISTAQEDEGFKAAGFSKHIHFFGKPFKSGELADEEPDADINRCEHDDKGDN